MLFTLIIYFLVCSLLYVASTHAILSVFLCVCVLPRALSLSTCLNRFKVVVTVFLLARYLIFIISIICYVSCFCVFVVACVYAFDVCHCLFLLFVFDVFGVVSYVFVYVFLALTCLFLVCVCVCLFFMILASIE